MSKMVPKGNHILARENYIKIILWYNVKKVSMEGWA